MHSLRICLSNKTKTGKAYSIFLSVNVIYITDLAARNHLNRRRHNTVGTVAKLYKYAAIFFIRIVGNRQKCRHSDLVTTIIVNEERLLANCVSLLKGSDATIAKFFICCGTTIVSSTCVRSHAWFFSKKKKFIMLNMQNH